MHCVLPPQPFYHQPRVRPRQVPADMSHSMLPIFHVSQSRQFMHERMDQSSQVTCHVQCNTFQTFSTHQLHPPQVMALAINNTESIQALFQPVLRVQHQVLLLEEIEVQLISIQDLMEDHHMTQGCQSIDLMQFQLRNVRAELRTQLAIQMVRLTRRRRDHFQLPTSDSPSFCRITILNVQYGKAMCLAQPS